MFDMSAIFFPPSMAMNWTYPYGSSTSLALIGGLLSHVIFDEQMVLVLIGQKCYSLILFEMSATFFTAGMAMA